MIEQQQTSSDSQEWILVSDNGLQNMIFGQLAAGLYTTEVLTTLRSNSHCTVELFNARVIMSQTVPLLSPEGGMAVQTFFKVMPFPTNPDGGHVFVRATMIIDVERDPVTKEMLMGQLKECREMEKAEKARRSRLVTPSIHLSRS
jgi:hypothetical protein